MIGARRNVRRQPGATLSDLAGGKIRSTLSCPSSVALDLHFFPVRKKHWSKKHGIQQSKACLLASLASSSLAKVLDDVVIQRDPNAGLDPSRHLTLLFRPTNYAMHARKPLAAYDWQIRRRASACISDRVLGVVGDGVIGPSIWVVASRPGS